MDSKVVFRFTQSDYLHIRNYTAVLLATHPWETLARGWLEEVTQLTHACKSWRLPTPELNALSFCCAVHLRALVDLANPHTAFVAELWRAWEGYQAACKERGRRTAQALYGEARLDARIAKGMNKNTFLTNSEYPELFSLCKRLSSERMFQYIQTHVLQQPTRKEFAKVPDLIDAMADDQHDLETIPNPPAWVRSIVTSRKQQKKRTERKRSAGLDVEDLAADDPEEIESQAKVKADVQLARKATGMPDNQVRLIEALLTDPFLQPWSRETPELLGWTPKELENTIRSLDKDQKVREFLDCYLPPDKRQG